MIATVRKMQQETAPVATLPTLTVPMEVIPHLCSCGTEFDVVFALPNGVWTPVTPLECPHCEQAERLLDLTDALLTNATAPRKAARPEVDWIRGECPECGEHLVSNCYFVGGKGYLIFLECWASLGDPSERTCDYRKVL